MIPFFENHHYRKLYSDLKDFDFYVEFSKKKIVYKPKKEEKKQQVLDFYETIKNNKANEITNTKKSNLSRNTTSFLNPEEDKFQCN